MAWVPPSRRKAQASEESEERTQIRRALVAVLNKISLTNFDGCVGDVEAVVEGHSRRDVIDVLGELLLQQMIDSTHRENFNSVRLSVCAALLGVLQTRNGAEFGSPLVELFVGHCQAKMAASRSALLESQQRQDEGAINIDDDRRVTSLVNCTVLLANLYCMQAVGSRFVATLVGALVADFSEVAIELLLACLKTCGPRLRSDDPAGLKEIVLAVQTKAAAATGSRRAQFMLDTILSLRNNREQLPQSVVDAQHRLAAYAKKTDIAGKLVPLAMSWEDMVHAKEHGRWWLVGSAWTGIRHDDGAAKPAATSTGEFSDELLALARENRMNTDVRRSVFCILMSAQDYLDAFEKLNKLNLRNKQDREIVHVLLYCCLKERKYNKYYGLVAHQLCQFNKNFRFTFQYALWDKFKLLLTPEMPVGEIATLAGFVADLLSQHTLPLSILKSIDFTSQLQSPRLVLFLRLLLVANIFASDEDENVVGMFGRLVAGSKAEHEDTKSSKKKRKHKPADDTKAGQKKKLDYKKLRRQYEGGESPAEDDDLFADENDEDEDEDADADAAAGRGNSHQAVIEGLSQFFMNEELHVKKVPVGPARDPEAAKKIQTIQDKVVAMMQKSLRDNTQDPFFA